MNEGATNDNLSKAEALLEEGKRAFSLQDYETSVSKLSDACQLLDSVHGELSPKNGDAYFLYGRALLQYAIQQNTVLGQSSEQQQQQPTEVPTKQEKPKDPRFHFEDDDEDEEQESEGEEAENEQAQQQDDDFEAAWDILDVARVMFEKAGDDKETKLKLADVHLCLGDVSVETEKFNEALPDYQKALEIKQEILPQDDRQIAEAHYKFALALEFSDKGAEAAAPEIKKAVDVLNRRVASLEQKLDGKGKGKGKEKATDTEEKTEQDIKEAKELIQDLNIKLEELTNRQNSEKQAEALLKSVLAPASQTGEKPDLSAITINDLTTLVKRKVRDAVKEDENAQKKQKQSEQ